MGLKGQNEKLECPKGPSASKVYNGTSCEQQNLSATP